MPKLTVEQEMKFGSALDQLEDAIEAAYASLRMVKWAQLNVARYAGGVLGPETNAKIRGAALDVGTLWELAQIPRKVTLEDPRALLDFVEAHNQKIVNIILAEELAPGHEDEAVERNLGHWAAE
jgi:hypothetical protein